MGNTHTRILITGASGFVGSYMVEQALACGYETWAAVRATSSKRYLQDSRIHLIELDYTDAATLTARLHEHSLHHGAWDIIIHCAGATRCLHKQAFYEANYKSTRRFVDTLRALDIVPRQFIYISTLGVYGPLHETPPFQRITDTDIPRPNTAYGQSKRAAERYLMRLPDFPYVIFRPTGVYGPRDKDYQVLIDSIRHHVELRLGYRRQLITFVYVRDLVQAVFGAISRGVVCRSYFVTDGNVYTARDFGRVVRKAVGNPFVMHLTLPLWMGSIASTLCDVAGRLMGKSYVFNRDKYRILKQLNWTCDITPLVDELGYHPQYDLEKGLEEMLASLPSHQEVQQ